MIGQADEFADNRYRAVKDCPDLSQRGLYSAIAAILADLVDRLRQLTVA